MIYNEKKNVNEKLVTANICRLLQNEFIHTGEQCDLYDIVKVFPDVDSSLGE